jgi:N4-gp56 family major capsid protein
MAGENTQAIYGDSTGTQSSIEGGNTQIRTDHYVKQALIEAREQQYFMPLADVTSMPKNMGKKIKKYHYMPLLDNLNVNDQGIDASGAVIADGNVYGGSKDIGVISGKLPAIGERGGRVNRVGFTRIQLEGTFAKFGFFDEYTQESVDFDTDADMRQHVSREMLNGASEMTEDALQIDILSNAGTLEFAGAATQPSEIGADADAEDRVVSYADLLRLHVELNDNRTPLKTKVISGTRMVDTRTIGGGRVLYCGSEMQMTLESMLDLHGGAAFVPVQQYAAGTTVMNGEIGSVGYFRIVIVPKMLNWTGAGAVTSGSTDEELFLSDGTNYNVYPMVCVGDGAFTTVGFQTDGKTVKFKIYHKAPGENVADRSDPYGETGFMSIKWYYGFFTQRSERIGLIYTAALQ